MLQINRKNFQECVIEKLENYLEENPTYDFRDEIITIDDLYLDMDGSVIYMYKWRDTSYSDSETGHNTVHETSNEEYAKLLTREEFKKVLRNENDKTS